MDTTFLTRLSPLADEGPQPVASPTNLAAELDHRLTGFLFLPDGSPNKHASANRNIRNPVWAGPWRVRPLDFDDVVAALQRTDASVTLNPERIEALFRSRASLRLRQAPESHGQAKPSA